MDWRLGLRFWRRERESAPTEDDLLAPEPRRFKVGDREIVVRPLVIGDFRRIADELSVLVKRLIAEHPEIDVEKPDQHLDVLLPICQDLLGAIFEKLFGVEAGYLEEHLTLAQASEILVALLELNQLPVIQGNALRALLLGKTLMGASALK